MRPTLTELHRKTSAKWTVYPPEVLPAWVADMDFELAPPIRAALDAQLARHDLGYPPMYERAGLAELFAARAARRYDWPISAGDIEFFSDVVQAIYLALLSLTSPGDGILIQTPIYPPFLHAVDETGRRRILCELVPGAHRYEIDFDALDAAAAQATLLLLCHPHNPTGRAYTREELERLAEIVLRHDLVVVSDEIHADLMLDDRRHIPFANLAPEIAARTITLTAASKAFNVAGLCLACAVFGSASLRAHFASLPKHVRGGRSTMGMTAAAAAWRDGDAWLAETLATLRANRDMLAAHVAREWPAIRHFPPEATYLAWLDCRALELGEEPCRWFLREAKVALGEGPSFGPPGVGCVRVNFATTPAILGAVLGRMSEALARRA
ncbi:MAG: MalY/PatB family protein [Gammaproteobacteria bacterium]